MIFYKVKIIVAAKIWIIFDYGKV